ncbi:hypothetical protein ACWIGM_27685 [Bosea sp. NPDC055332]
MTLFETLRAAFASWFERAVLAEAGEPRWLERSLAELGAEERRRSIREVTLEQLGIAHWSCHTHF